MSQRPCWNYAELLKVLKPDAEEIQDEVFRAVHCETELQLAETANGPRRPATPQKLLELFLDPQSDYVQAVVLGESGTGKSHLIQWLRLHLPQRDDMVVLTIPRSGTSLRGIVKRIIDALPPDEREPYERRLVQAGSQSMTKEAKVEKFLSELALAIRHAGLRDDSDADLADLLPDVLNDPSFRKGFFLRPGAAVDLIVQHVFVDPAERDQNEERREFRRDDLPLDGAHYELASYQAKEAIDFIKGEDGMEDRAIALMNQHRDMAIAHTMNFSADQLIELMNTLRRHLARQQKKLILLIEDFARVQGIDTALLQALITPPAQGEERLCEIRWAMAVTSGPFARVAETVRSRATIVVDMNASRPASLARLTAGYLNAVRLGPATLLALPGDEPVPSHCAGCALRSSCWDAFGSADGIGLFPFTATSIDIMARRTGSQGEDGAVNPRQYMRRVLQQVLKNEYTALEDGEYPSEELLTSIGGDMRMRPIDRQRLHHEDKEHAARRIALLELYDGQGQIVNLRSGIHAAFALPPFSNAGTAALEPVVDDTVGGGEQDTGRDRLPPHVDIVHRWATGGEGLPQTTVNELRQLVFAALEGYIDWDALGMRKAAVATASQTSRTAFRQASINFPRQQGLRNEPGVVLDIVEKDAVALEALLINKAFSGWDFPEGALMMAHLLESLRRWGDSVTRQLRALYGPQPDWDPVAAATELLAIAAYLGGKVKVEHATDSLVGRMWELSGLSPGQGSEPRLRKLGDDLHKALPKLQRFLKDHAAGIKGGKQGNFLRPWPVMRAVRALRHGSLRLSMIPPEKSNLTELNEIFRLYRRVQGELADAVAAEKAARKRWVQEVTAAIGADTTVASLVDALRDTIDHVVEARVGAGLSRSQLQEVLDNLKPNALDTALAHAKALEGASMAESLARFAAIGAHPETIDRLVAKASAFLEAAEAGRAYEQSQLEARSGKGLVESEERIENALGAVAQTLGTLAGLPGGVYEPA